MRIPTNQCDVVVSGFAGPKPRKWVYEEERWSSLVWTVREETYDSECFFPAEVEGVRSQDGTIVSQSVYGEFGILTIQMSWLNLPYVKATGNASDVRCWTNLGFEKCKIRIRIFKNLCKYRLLNQRNCKQISDIIGSVGIETATCKTTEWRRIAIYIAMVIQSTVLQLGYCAV